MASNNLSEIAKDNSWAFSSYYDGSGNYDKRVQLAQLKSELELARINYDRVTTTTQRDKIGSQIAALENEIKNLSNVSDANATSFKNKSLFDSAAYLDYGRNYQSATWEDNKRDKSDSTKNIFVINNPGFDMNKPVQGDPIDPSKSTGLTVAELIEWSETYPALQLRFQDFVFCKHLGLYPNNRLVILRRFKQGVPDNLFDYYRDKEYANTVAPPISTMVTWVKPDKDFFKISFSEGWSPNQKSDFFSSFTSKKPAEEGSFLNFQLYNLGDNSMFFALLSSLEKSTDNIDGSTTDFSVGKDKVGNFLNEPGGNPNLIRNAAMRNIGGERSLSSSISFELEFEFQMRYMQGVDPGVVMLDLISNCARMGTSVSQFRFDLAALQTSTIQRIINGDYEVEIEGLFAKMSDEAGKITQTFVDLLTGLGKSLASGIKNTFTNGDKAGEVITNVSQMILSRYRENIKHALAGETGLPSGVWHVTIGNPKNPIISCGDMVISDSSLTLGKELGYNDFPNSFTYNIQVISARERGRNEIERIFNAGRGRVYVYNKPSDNPDYHLLKIK